MVPVISAEIIIINETKPQLYAMESVILSGDLRSNALSINGQGEVIIGENVKVYLFGMASDVLVEKIVIDGKKVPVSFDDKGYFFVAEKGKFAFYGGLKIRTPGQVKLYIHGPMNELKFDIKNGYAIGGDKYGLYDSEVIIQRSGKVATLVDGNFKFAYAERNEFYYQVNYRAFGKSLGREEILLNNGENVISVVGAKDYSVQGKKLILELEGGEASVVVSGTFDSTNLRVPLAEGTHHVLIESDPEKKITISTDAREVDLSESTLGPAYGNARAFLASDKSRFTIVVTTLEKYPSLAAPVGSATNRVAVTELGSMLGELYYRYSNTGVDYIEIDAPGTPLYAAANSGAVKLTKDGGKLFLSLPKTGSGSGNLDMIYFEAGDALGLAGNVKIPVANTLLPVTQQTTTIYLPSDYTVLYTFGAKGGSEIPALKSIVLFILLIGGLGIGLKNARVFVAPYVAFMGGLLLFDNLLFAVAVIISIVLVIKRYVAKGAVKWMLAGAGVLVVLALFTIVLFSVMGVFSGAGSSGSNARIASGYAVVEEAPAPMAMKSLSILGEGTGAISVPQREGVLPVRLELPNLGKSVTVTNYLVTKETPVELSMVIVSNHLKWLLYLAALVAGLMCYRVYCRK